MKQTYHMNQIVQANITNFMKLGQICARAQFKLFSFSFCLIVLLSPHNLSPRTKRVSQRRNSCFCLQLAICKKFIVEKFSSQFDFSHKLSLLGHGLQLWSFSLSVQLHSSRVHYAHQRDIQLNTQREIPYLGAPCKYQSPHDINFFFADHRLR